MSFSNMIARAAWLILPLCLAAPSFADVIYVDAGGNGQYTGIQQAIDAAIDGDVLLVRKGIYGGFTLHQRNLSVVADAGAQPSFHGTVTVSNTASNATVLLAGLDIVGGDGFGSLAGRTGLDIASNTGHVRIQGCTVRGGRGGDDTQHSGNGGNGTVIHTSPKVVFSACTSIGGMGGGIPFFQAFGGNGGHGVVESNSGVAFYDCVLQGGVGGMADYIEVHFRGGDGGDGCQVQNYGILASGCHFEGGMGGSEATLPGNGGDGLVVLGGQAQLIDNTYAGGIGGWSYYGTQGLNGLPQSGSGVFHTIPGKARKCSAPALAAENATLQFDLAGDPGDRVWLLSSSVPAFLFVPTYAGIQCVPLPSLFGARPLAVLPASGTASIAVPTPILGAGTPTLRRYWQGLAISASGQFRLMSPTNAVVLNCSDLLPDCNGNGSCDTCDLVQAISFDCDKNGVPDDCQLDCNANGLADPCDIASGISDDLNHNGIPDECEPQTTWYVDDSASPGGNGSSGTPFQSLLQAFTRAISGDTVLVADGLYQGSGNRNLDFGDRELVVASLGGAANCVIDCQAQGSAFLVRVGVSSASRVEGFTIRNGKPAGQGTRGGGIELEQSSPVIRACAFVSCQAQINGGAIAAYGGFPSIQGCSFIGNFTLTNGAGAVWIQGGTVLDCEFIDNHGRFGGAVACEYELVRIERCSFLANTATDQGGAVYTYQADVSLDQCWISGNSAARGGALADQQSSWSVTNCTISDNHATVQAGAAYLSNAFQAPTVRAWRNSVLWNNTSQTGTPIRLVSGPLDIAWCDVQGGQASVSVGAQGSLTWGPGNIDLDPLFADPDGPDNDPLTIADNDYRLSLASPCIDSGENASVEQDWFDLDGDGNVTEPVPVDFDGASRFVEVPSAPNTGSGAPPLVDFGAWERP